MESRTLTWEETQMNDIFQEITSETDECLNRLHKGKNLAKNYAMYRPGYPKKIYDEMMSYHKEVLTNGHQLALDVCCGTGLSTLPLVPLFDKVAGVDISEDLMEYLPRDVPNLTALVCPAENMTMLGSGTMDLVTVATGLHWLNIEKFLQEAKRILKPGSTFAAYSWQTGRLEPEAANQAYKEFKTKYKNFMTSKMILSYEKYQSIKFPFQDLRRFEMEIPVELNIEEYKGYLGSMHFIKLYNEANPGSDPVEEFCDRLKSILSPKGGKDQDVKFKVFRRLFLIMGRNG